MVKKIKRWLHQQPAWLWWLLIVLALLRIPSLFEPYSYGDEMIYLTLGQGVRQGVPLYLGLHDNKPPLLYLLAALAGSLAWYKFILGFWMLTTTLIYHRLLKQLRLSLLTGQIAAVAFGLLTTLPLLEGNIANAELFMLMPTLIAFSLLLKEPLTNLRLLGGGIAFATATLFKVPAAFDMVALFFWWIANTSPKLWLKKIPRRLLLLAVGFITVIGSTFVYYALTGGLWEYTVAAFLQNFGYLSSWNAQKTDSFLVRNWFLLVRGVLGIFFSLLAIWWHQRQKIGSTFLVMSLWLIWSLFAASLSERPYPHYLVQALPALAYFLGLIFNSRHRHQVVSIIPLSLFLLVPLVFRFWYYPTSSYYLRFINYLTKQTDWEDYLSAFSPTLPRTYKIAQILAENSQSTDRVFVWGDSSVYYALSRRLPPIKYTADYHIRDFSSLPVVLKQLKEKPPKLIVLTPEAPAFNELQLWVEDHYAQLEQVQGVKIWRLIRP